MNPEEIRDWIRDIIAIQRALQQLSVSGYSNMKCLVQNMEGITTVVAKMADAADNMEAKLNEQDRS